jgi:GNAT superfamily N-acetyltransferase
VRCVSGRSSIGEPSPGFSVRPVQAQDRDALAALYADMGAYYAELAPEDFTMPDLTSFEPPSNSPELLHLVAELHGEVVAAVAAVLLAPEDAHGIDPGLAVSRLRIDFLATTTAHRRTGAGTALVAAAEAWGRDRGAQVAETWTYARSPLSMPFWTERAGYQPRSMILRKPLRPT